MKHRTSHKRQKDVQDWRILAVAILFTTAFFVVAIRLFTLMIWQHSFYTALASGSHEMYAQLFPERGNVYITSRSEDQIPFAINRDLFLMYADTREIEDVEQAEDVAEQLAEIFGYDDERKLAIYLQLIKIDDPYEPIEKKIDETVVEDITSRDIPGIHFVRRPHRFYPEGELAAQIIGFLGKDEEGNDIGRYGLEGYWQQDIAGSGGFLEGARTAQGSWIPLAGRNFKAAEDGVDITLTIDRTLQFRTCEILRDQMAEYEAQSASLVIMEPHTGAIRVMCSLPDFDPNEYGKVEDIAAYNNTTIFTPYEPGSIFKPIAMAAALNEDLITPHTYFHDTGSVEAGCLKPIYNADLKEYGDQTMTGVLENSINTGMVYVVKQLGKKMFREYVEQFGFGVKTGIELDTESSGTVDSLYRNNKDNIDCYTATGSFGQGLTTTPLQMVSAFAAIANGGNLMRPYIIEKIVHADETVEHTEPITIRQVIKKRASQLISGMLVRVIDEGQAGAAQVEGYYLGGKTGTAQISEGGKYIADTNHSFVGFGPVDDPAFVMIVKFEKPKRAYSSSTAAPTFREIARVILEYYQIAPDY